jgi:hypothetical protein
MVVGCVVRVIDVRGVSVTCCGSTSFLLSIAVDCFVRLLHYQLRLIFSLALLYGCSRRATVVHVALFELDAQGMSTTSFRYGRRRYITGSILPVTGAAPHVADHLSLTHVRRTCIIKRLILVLTDPSIHVGLLTRLLARYFGRYCLIPVFLSTVLVVPGVQSCT